MGALKPWHIIVLILAFIILFGWKNLPNVARSLGQSARVFKSEVDQMKEENEKKAGAHPADGPEPVDTATREYREQQALERRSDVEDRRDDGTPRV